MSELVEVKKRVTRSKQNIDVYSIQESPVGVAVGFAVGIVDGAGLGTIVGLAEGTALGAKLGTGEGTGGWWLVISIACNTTNCTIHTHR